jgi:Caudovirus prohead serine protease
VRSGCDYVIQGIAAEFEKPYSYRDEFWMLKSGCFDNSLRFLETELWADHDPSKGRFGSMKDRLQIHSGSKSLAFRYFFPNGSIADELDDVADDMLNYVGISISHNPTKTEKIKIEGVDVTLVHDSRLVEISVLSSEPAVKSTYAYVASLSGCNDLQHDYEAGLFDLRGKAIGLHRKITANESGGKINYKHVTSALDRAANRFQRLLGELA